MRETDAVTTWDTARDILTRFLDVLRHIDTALRAGPESVDSPNQADELRKRVDRVAQQVLWLDSMLRAMPLADFVASLRLALREARELAGFVASDQTAPADGTGQAS